MRLGEEEEGGRKTLTPDDGLARVFEVEDVDPDAVGVDDEGSCDDIAARCWMGIGCCCDGGSESKLAQRQAVIKCWWAG